jgi:hypothetical protein
VFARSQIAEAGSAVAGQALSLDLTSGMKQAEANWYAKKQNKEIWFLDSFRG